MKKLGVQDDDLGTTSTKVMALISRDFGFQLLNKLKKDKSLIGKTVDRDRLLQGRRRPLFQGRDQALDRRKLDRKLDNQQLDWLEQLRKDGSAEVRVQLQPSSPTPTPPSPNRPGCWARWSARP
jgi:phosphate transport system permease protein